MNRIAAVVGLLAVAFLPGLAPAAEEGPLRVLFLGDQGPHRPADRAAQLIPVLAGRGIDVTYTEDAGVLAGDFLSRFDALVVYANTERITPEQEAGLLAYVENGGGFVPVHCASFCFQNSPKYVALVGGQFKSHGTGDFETEVVAPDHPVMRGLRPFVTWDETYVHDKHNEEGRTVLQVRAEGDRQEPWTWVREQGKGRVFYTAYGHDARTWMQPGFQALLERGIRWAANKGEVFDGGARPQEGLRPFEYAEAEGGLPNYVAGEKWGTTGEAITKMQKPVEPEESRKHLVVPAGFRAELFASEPEIVKPIAMAWDEKGRLWVAETFDYPNEMKPAGQGRDRIKVCEDTDGDGKADKFTVFAEKLSIPTSFAFAYGGVVVTQAPDVLFLKDADGDGRAEVREVLFTGWKTNDTHAGPSNLRYGFDGWYYGMVGYAGFEGEVGGERHQFRQGFFRFKLDPPGGGGGSGEAGDRGTSRGGSAGTSSSRDVPRVARLEFLRSVNNNAWGVGFSEEGLLFGSTANGCPSVFCAIPNRYYEAVRGWSPRVLESISPSNRFFAITDQVRQVDHHGGFTSAAGHALYTARAYPKPYWNRTAFVSDPTGHLTAAFVLQPKGSDFAAYNSWNLVASDDEWTAPIVAEVGPDGNVWVIDWYNYVVQHNPTPAGFETGKGNAYETPLRDKRHGRVYRIVAEDSKAKAAPEIDPNDAGSLVAALDSDNLFWRLTGQRLLAERGKTDVVPALVKRAKERRVDETGLDAGATHALWTLRGLTDGRGFRETASGGGGDDTTTALREAVTAGLGSPSAAVRRAAALVAPRDGETVAVFVKAEVAADKDPQVRLATLLALAEVSESEDAAEAAAAALADPATAGDRWLSDAVTAAGAANPAAFLKAVAAGKGLEPRASAVVARVAEHYARGKPEAGVGEVLVAVSKNPAVAEAVLAGFDAGWADGVKTALDPAAEEVMGEMLAGLSPEGQSRLVRLAGQWGSKGLEKYAAEIVKGFLAAAGDESKSDEERVSAATRLIEFRAADAGAATGLLELMSPKSSPELARGLIAAVGKSEAAEVGGELVGRLGSGTPAAREASIRVLLSRPEWTEALMAGVDEGTLQLSDLALDQRQALANHPNGAIAARAKEMLAKGGGLPSADRQKVIEELSPLVLRGGDVAKGKLVFTQQCAKCHRHSGEGSDIGPDLTGMATHPREELMIHILDPNRSVEGNFRQYTVLTAEGVVLNGLLASETRTSIEIVDAEGKRHPVLREDIEELVASTKSVMPEGFEKQVPPEGIRDLLAFMTQRGKYLPLDLRKAATITSALGMFFTKDDETGRLVFPDWSPKVVDGVPFQVIDPQGGRVSNVVMLNGPNGTFPPRMPKSVRVPVRSPAVAIHLLSGVSGWGYPYAEKGTTSMVVRLHYADGTTEDHELKNGVHFADYIRVVDVPESKLAFQLRGRQIRYLAVRPEKGEEIAEVEFVKGEDETAPIVMAATVESPESKPEATGEPRRSTE